MTRRSKSGRFRADRREHTTSHWLLVTMGGKRVWQCRSKYGRIVKKSSCGRKAKKR